MGKEEQNPQVEAFKEALECCHLQDLGFSGYPYTWSNKGPGEANTKIRLDRVVANNEWLEKFQMSKLIHLSTHASDHLPIMLHVQTYVQVRQKRKRSFKFEESWLLSSECEMVMQEAWGRAGEEGHGMASVQEKIKLCGAELLAWGSSSINPDTRAIKDLQKKLDFLNESVPTEATKAKYLELSKKMDELLQKQEIFWAQRSRINWLKHGDKNTKFFHAIATQRRNKNHIRGIQNADDSGWRIWRR